MTQPGDTAISRKTAARNAAWLARLPNLEGNEEKLLELIGKCYSVYLAGTTDIKALAVEFNIPVDILVHWARDGKWLQRRDDFRQELLVNVETEYAMFVKDNRVKTAKEIVDKLLPKVGSIGDAIELALASDDTVAVRRLAEALKHVSDIVTKAVGLDAPMPQSDRAVATAAKNEDAQGKQPWLSIHTKGPVQVMRGDEPPPGEPKSPIDVQVSGPQGAGS